MLTQTQQDELRRRLERERTRLRQIIAQLGEEVEELADYEDAEQSTLGNHPADGGTDLFEQEEWLGIEQNEQEVLDRVEHALSRMDEGTYGICEDCGRPIPVERLQALPYATLCVEDQARREREGR